MTPQAVSPGSVTGFFRPEYGPTPATTVSRGLAFCLAQGVTAAVRAAATRQVILNGTDIDIAVVTDVLDTLAPEPVRVELETAFPLGCGFGVSAAAALATAFAVNHRFSLGQSPLELGLIAHVAEVTHRTGIGDVAAQLTGGIVFRRCDGGPFDTLRLDHLGSPRLWYRTFGPLSTKTVLTGPTTAAAIDRAGGDRLDWLRTNYATATLADLMVQSHLFATSAGLLTNPDVTAAIADVHAAGGTATMAMLGQTVLATTPGRSGEWIACDIDPLGTRTL